MKQGNSPRLRSGTEFNSEFREGVEFGKAEFHSLPPKHINRWPSEVEARAKLKLITSPES